MTASKKWVSGNLNTYYFLYFFQFGDGHESQSYHVNSDWRTNIFVVKNTIFCETRFAVDEFYSDALNAQ